MCRLPGFDSAPNPAPAASPAMALALPRPALAAGWPRSSLASAAGIAPAAALVAHSSIEARPSWELLEGFNPLWAKAAGLLAE